MGWWAANLWQESPVLLVSWIFWLIASITLHELAHGWTAIRHGDDTPIHTGHMTVNPVVHLGPTSLIVLALLGFAWGSMPVDPTRLKGRHADAMVAAAGPSMNIGLAVTCLVLAVLVATYARRAGVPEDVANRFHLFLAAGSMLNVVLAVFNLVPIPPLDGSRVVASFSGRYSRFASSSLGKGALFIAMALLFFRAGHLLFGLAFWSFREGSGFLTSLLP